jgi:(1->4)-alpha-D-glucan 1-alpha-D-glucosylmutase
VDPHNRRPVNFGVRQTALASLANEPDLRALARSWQDGRVKLCLMRHLLALRRELPDVFVEGRYEPLELTGPHRERVLAIARWTGQKRPIFRHADRIKRGIAIPLPGRHV